MLPSIIRRKIKGDWYGRQARLADNTCDVIFGAPMANAVREFQFFVCDSFQSNTDWLSLDRCKYSFDLVLQSSRYVAP